MAFFITICKSMASSVPSAIGAFKLRLDSDMQLPSFPFRPSRPLGAVQLGMLCLSLRQPSRTSDAGGQAADPGKLRRRSIYDSERVSSREKKLTCSVVGPGSFSHGTLVLSFSTRRISGYSRSA